MSNKGLMSAVLVLALVLAALAPAALAQSTALPPAVRLADLPSGDLSDKDWSDVQTDGEVKCRAALKGKVREIPVKAWWGEKALRPPEGAMYVVEVRYKDTVQTPAIFYSFGGLGSDRGPSEVHRFGGSGDGQWKTAAVPVSWDYLIRLPAARDKTAFGVRAEADLPVASLTFRAAAAGDEQRYNAETRAWVAQVQKNLAAKTPVKVEDPKFKVPSGSGAGPIVAFAWPAMVALLPNAQPKTEQVGAPVKVRMCLNEMESGSFGVYAAEDLKGVDYAVSELKGPSGVLVADVVRRTAEYCLVGANQGGTRWLPQRLWPAYAVDIPKGRSHWFVFNLRTRRGATQPGLYKGEVVITSDRGKAVLPVEVEVLPIDLLTMEEAGLSMGGCTAGLVPAHDVAFQAAYNQNGTNLWFSGVQPDMELKDGTLKLDFTYMDEWMATAKKRGLVNVVYFLGGNPYGFPRTMTLQRELYRLKNKASVLDFNNAQGAEGARDKMLADIRPLYVEWNRQIAKHAKEAGWPELIVTPFDEPAKWVQGPGRTEGSGGPGVIGTGPWIKPYFKDSCAAIKEGDPSLKIYGSIHHSRLGKDEGLTFLPDIDVFCAGCIDEDQNLGNKVRAGKKIFWQYSGLGSGAPDEARFTFGFYFASFGSVGSLCWAYNWGSGFNTTSGSNWMYAWQTPFDTIPAPYFEGMREAWDDCRVIETYKKKFAGNAEAMGALAKIFEAAQTSRAPGGRDTVNDFWAAVDDVGKLDRWRNELLDRLAKAGK